MFNKIYIENDTVYLKDIISFTIDYKKSNILLYTGKKNYNIRYKDSNALYCDYIWLSIFNKLV